MVDNINMLDASIELSILCEGNYVLIITENDGGFKVYIVRAKELIKQVL